MNTRAQHRSLLVSLLALAAASACNCDGCGPASKAGSGIVVVDAKVRACDVVFTSPVLEVPTAVFSDAVIGEAIPKAPRLAVSFAAKKDASLENVPVVTLHYTGAAQAAALGSVRCFDKEGTVVPGAPVEVKQ